MKRKLINYLEIIGGLTLAFVGLAYLLYTTVEGFFFSGPLVGFIVDLIAFGLVTAGYLVFRKGLRGYYNGESL